MNELKIINHSSGHVEKLLVDTSPPDLEAIEREWRDNEILRTDKLIVLPDYPTDLTAYRVELRDYPAQSDFPNGTRPVE